ncbi:MAG: hypothetical protein CSA84_03285 [Actinomycetales bacterium]|nr:MAG: hypothetical protein CSA84_03285 [Actinomycetales bacterium]
MTQPAEGSAAETEPAEPAEPTDTMPDQVPDGMPYTTPDTMPDTTDRQAVIDLLGALSYAQLSGFEALAADAQVTPNLRAKLSFARLAVSMFLRCERVVERLEELGVGQEEAMVPFAAAVDSFHQRTAPIDWLEGIVKAYVGDGIVRDFYLDMGQRLTTSDRDFIVGMLSPVAESPAIAVEVLKAVTHDARVHGRLSLWGRRILGEALQTVQTVASERDALAALLAGDESGPDPGETGRLLARLTEGHTRRMKALGLSA